MIQDKLRTVDQLGGMFLGAGLIFYVALWLVAFEGVALIISSVLEFTSLKDSASDPKFLNLWAIDFIVAGVFIMWLHSHTDGYAAMGEAYVRLCSLSGNYALQLLALSKSSSSALNVERTAMALAQAQAGGGGLAGILLSTTDPTGLPTNEGESTHGGEESLTVLQGAPPPLVDPVDADIRASAEARAAACLARSCELRKAMRDICVAILWYGYRIFDGSDGKEPPYELSAVVTRAVRASTGALESASGVFADKSALGGLNVIRLNAHLQVLLLKYQEELLELGDLRLSGVQQLQQAYRELHAHILNLEVMTSVVTPRIFQQHYNLILFFAFIVWMPYQFWARVGYTETLIAYPIIIFLLSAPAIYRTWFGESFDPKANWRFMNHQEQRQRYVHEIMHTYRAVAEATSAGEARPASSFSSAPHPHTYAASAASAHAYVAHTPSSPSHTSFVLPTAAATSQRTQLQQRLTRPSVPSSSPYGFDFATNPGVQMFN